MNNNYFPQYTTDYISGVMSLRKPQTASLKILEEIVNSVSLRKGMNLKAALGAVHAMYPICSDFEREFMSLTFALATGVGKTRLMGAFIAYLYTQHNIKNFFVVAPNTTIYEKLKRDLSDWNSSKYVFKGLGCFSTPPQIITDDDYRTKNLEIFDSEVHIFVFNIDKFNKEDANMKKVNELLGDSFYQYLSNLPDLVLIMDESHHYRAEKGAQALNELHPLLGLELTATPLVASGSKQIPFKNVVYEYPLSRAIEDGYTRTPFAVTRSDIDFYNFGDDQLDKMMLVDGIACHENTKRKLEMYALNNSTPEKPIRIVKPFMLVVCKDTDHAAWVESFIKSDEFREGAYRNKTITVHSKQKGAESEANTRLLLDVESEDNPIEIVIHVNMLKEGWDVNNLYTIVPLRTAASKILREQMVGRGLRLPYGERTGDKDVDAVMLTAHDKFNDILAEAQKGDSIFKAGNVIKAEEIVPEKIASTQLKIEFEPDKVLETAYSQTNIEKSEVAGMPTAAFSGRIITIDTIADADKAVKALSSEKLLGIDTETRPSFRKGLQYEVSLIQLSTADTCFLIRLNRTGMPDSLVSLLENKDIIKVGLSLHDDYQSLCRRRKFKAGGFLDLQQHVTKYGIEEKSLQKIFAIVFGQRISKSQQLTNWENDVLTDKQKLYAATDAWACLEIYNKLEQTK